jgi:ABC-type transport system involved in multi-copper enzyme maturation permease subunit
MTMPNGLDPTAESAQAVPAPRAAMRTPRDDASLADRLFLAIENPVLRRELLTALRSNKAFILHFVFLLGLGLVVYLAWPPGQVSTAADLARKLFHTFGQSELVLLAMLAPAFSASAMTIEKERRCMDLLLTSPIHPRTILMGKYLSAVLYLLLLVLSTAPLVSVIMWLPGLSPGEITGLFVLLFAVALCFGMIGLSCSVFFHRSQASLAVTYMIVLPLALILLTCAVAFDGFFLLENALWPSGFMLIGTVVMYRACDARLRRPFDPVYKAGDDEDVATQTGLVLVRDRFPDCWIAPPRTNELLPDGVNPVYQKEIRTEVFGRGTLFVRLIIQMSMFLSVVFLTFLYLSKEHIFVWYLALFTILVAPAFGCNTFTQERERGTLDLLLTTLVRPGQIVSGKFISCLRLSLFLTGLVGVTMGFYVFVGHDDAPLRVFYLLVYVLILLTCIVFETALAMAFSLVFHSTVQSMISTYTILMLLFAAPVAAEQLLLTFTKMQRAEMMWLLVLNPFDAIYSVSSKGSGSVHDVTVWPAFLLLYGVLSALLLAYVYAFFEKQSLESRKVM